MTKIRFGLGMLVLSLAMPWLAKADETIVWGIAEVNSSTRLLLFNSSFQLLKRMPTDQTDLVGLSLNPVDRKLYAMQGTNAPTKRLVTLAKKSGTATLIGDDSGVAISDTAFRSDGTLFAVGSSDKSLFSVDTLSGQLTTVKSEVATDSEAGLSFDNGGKLILADFNTLDELDPATGDEVSSVLLDGNFNNILITDANNALVGGLHNEFATVLFFIDALTGVTTQRGSFAGVDLKGVAFDTAKPPTFRIDGKSRIETTKRTITLEGTYNSVVPCTFTAKGVKNTVENGTWRLKISGLKSGRQQFRLRCVDALGQSAAFRTITVTVRD